MSTYTQQLARDLRAEAERLEAEARKARDAATALENGQSRRGRPPKGAAGRRGPRTARA